jgi:hypothetical protein
MTWADDGTLLAILGGSLYRWDAGGGDPEVLTAGQPGQAALWAQPHMLPGSQAVLFHIKPALDPARAELVALDLDTGEQTTVLTNAMDPRYVETGHLLFVRQGALMAVGFDVRRLEAQGEPVILVPDVMQSILLPNSGYETGAAQVAVSAAGHLAYARGGVYPEVPNTLVRIRRNGQTEPLDLEERRYRQVRVSPDGDRLAVMVGPGLHTEIWIHDLLPGRGSALEHGRLLQRADGLEPRWPMAGVQLGP